MWHSVQSPLCGALCGLGVSFSVFLATTAFGTVAGLAGYTAGDVAIRTELFRSADRAAGDKGSQTQGNQKSL